MTAERTQEARPERAKVPKAGSRLGPPARVVDVDEVRAGETEALLAPLAERLGFRVGDIRVRVDEQAAARTRPRGSRGVLAGDTIWLDPASYDPRRADGRALLAHEAAHAAQRAETRLRPDRRAPSLVEAEREAAEVADAVREGRVPRRPGATLPPGVEAADTGATALAERAPALDEVRDPLAVYRSWQNELDALVDNVKRIYRRQLSVMRDNLDGWWVSDGDVDRVMAVLEPLPVEDAAALVRALGSRMRVRLVDNVSGSHRRNFRRAVLASYAGLTWAELKYFDQGLFSNLSLVQLGVQERFLAVLAVLNMRIEVQRRLLDGDRAAEFRPLMRGRAPDPAERLAELRLRAGELQRRREVEDRVENDPRTTTLLATLERLLRDPTEADARAALRLLTPLVPGAAPAETPVESTAAPAETPATPAAGLQPAELTVVMERLEQSGAVNRLIRNLSSRDRYQPGPLRDAFLAVLRARPVDANVRLAISLLDTGLFSDWWVTDAEARLAYDIVQSLPLDARDSFFRRDDGSWLQKLEENLPEDVLGRPDFADFSIRDESGRLVDVGARRAETLRGREGSRVLADVLRSVERERGSTGARRILAELAAIQPPEVREAVIGRLDTLGRLSGLINGLADDVLFSEAWRIDLGVVLAARDPRHLERHIRSLLATGFLRLDWAVNSREAFLAFQMLRALPPADRERFGQLNFIVGEMSASMRASAGLHMLDGRSAAAQRDAVRARLRDERLWTAEHAPELRSLVGILVALGDRGWVFDRSREQRAWEVAALRPMVKRFRLYDEREGRTQYVPEQVEEARFWDDYGVFSIIKIVGKVLCIVVRDGFWGRLYANPVAEELGHTGFPLSRVQDMLGGDVAGVRFRDPDAASDEDERAAASAGRGGGEQVVSTNEVSMRWNQRVGMLWLSLPALELDTIGMVGTSWSLHTGRVSARGINVWAEFQTDDFSHPRQADIRVSDIELDDVLVGSENDFKSVARVHLGALGIRGDMGAEPPPPANSTLLPIPVFGPLIEWIRLLVEARRMATGASEQLTAGAGELRGVTVEVGTIELEGLSLGADQQIASLSIAGLRLAWGGTRTQYLRALIAALDRRIAAATEGTELDRLRVQRDEAQRELRELVPNERRLLELIRRSQSDPDSITAADNAEILRLQQTGRGGVVLDAGTITVRGLGGTVSAREITVDRLRGQGTSEALTASVLTDPVLLQRFVREGPPLEEAPPPADRSAIELEAGTVTAIDVAVEAKIPATAVLEQQRTQLMTDRVRLERAHETALLGRVDARIDFLRGLIRLRSELDALEALETRASREQVQRRRELHTLLGRYFGISVGRAELRGVTIGGDLERGTLGARAAELEVTDVASDAFGVARVTGTDISGALPFAAGLAGLQRLPETLGPEGARAGVGTLRLEGVRADALGSTVGAVDLTGFSASAQRVPGGWRIPDLRIGSLAIDGIDYGTADRRLRSTRPLTLSGIEASVTVTTAGEGDAAQTSYAIERVDIAEITAGTSQPDPALTYDDLVTGMRVSLFGGALRGIWAAGLTIRQSDVGTTIEKPVDTPVGGVRQFDALRFSTALAGSFKLGGVLSSPQGQAQDAFGVQFAADGAAVVDLLNFALSDATLTTPNGSVRIERARASGRVRYRSEGEISDIGLESFRVPELVLGRIDWRMEDGATVTADGRSVLTGIVATVAMHMDAEGLARATVTRLRIDRIRSDGLAYRKPPTEITVYDATGAPALDVRDVAIDGLPWDRDQGITRGTVGVGSAEVAGAGWTLGAGASGRLRAQRISLKFEPRKLTARAEQVDADLEVGAGGVNSKIGITGLDTGTIEVTDTQIRVGADALPNLRLGTAGRITIPALEFDDRIKGLKIKVDGSGAAGAGIELRGLDTALTIDLNPPGVEPRLRRVTIDELRLDQVTATELTIDDEANGSLKITGPTGRATLVDARVSKLALDALPAGGFAMAGYERMSLDMLALEGVQVEVAIADILRRRAAAAAGPAAGPSAPFDPKALEPFMELFDSLDGHINMDVDVYGVYTVEARIAIKRGRVDVEEIEDVAFGRVADEFLDFELDDGDLILQFDPARAGLIFGLLGGGLGLLAREDLMRWNLRTGEVDTFPELSLYSLTQIKRATSSGGGDDDESSMLEELEFRDVDVALSLVNEYPLELPLPGGLGTATLAAHGLRDLTIKGALLQPGFSAPHEFQISLGTVLVQSISLDLGAFGSFESGALRLDGLTDGTLLFFGIDPIRFTGRVQSLIWRELELRGTPAPPLASAVPTPAGATP